jgi:hypothetical protein
MESESKMNRAMAAIVGCVLFAGPAWGDELQCRRCVDTSDIRANAVTSGKIKDRSIRYEDLGPSVREKFGDIGATGLYEFVGFSLDTATNGGVGLPAMNALCQEVFGDMARMANSKEYILSPIASAPGPENAGAIIPH